MTRRESVFLELIGIFGFKQNDVDVEYLRVVHFERWAETEGEDES